MLILGLQGSPRKKGNTQKLLVAFLAEAERLGATTRLMDIPRMSITPCVGCGNCERNGFCPIDDDMQKVYPLMHASDIIVLGTPVYFYGVSAQLKALIDRSQALWSRKYVHKMVDPGRTWRKGIVVSVGATKGKDLFDGVNLTAKYFFDAVGANYEGGLFFRNMEAPGDVEKSPTALKEAEKKARILVEPFMNRRKILFVSEKNACVTQMAEAFARHYAGDTLDVCSAGTAPAERTDPIMVEIMGEIGMDLKFVRPKSLEAVPFSSSPDVTVLIGSRNISEPIPNKETYDWGPMSTENMTPDAMRSVRDNVERKVREMTRVGEKPKVTGTLTVE